jgi:hypothetical protein
MYPDKCIRCDKALYDQNSDFKYALYALKFICPNCFHIFRSTLNYDLYLKCIYNSDSRDLVEKVVCMWACEDKNVK